MIKIQKEIHTFMNSEKLSFELWLETYCGMTEEEFSKLCKEERRAIRKEYEEDDGSLE